MPPSFVDDLIPLILEAHDHWWPRDLSNLSSLSSSWLYYVRKRLYSHPSIHSFAAATLLSRTFIENPDLSFLVSALCLRPIVKDPSLRPKVAEWKAVRHLLGLEGLTRISLGGELAVKAERFLRYLGNPDALQELHIDGSLLEGRLTSCPSLEWDDSLSFAFPELRVLRLSAIELDVSTPSASYTSPIASLSVENVHIIEGHLVNLMGEAESLSRLHITTKEAAVYDEEIRLMLASCAVECLHYEMRKDSNSSSLLLDAPPESLALLRCLHLDGVFVDALVLRAVEEMCQNLVELVVSGRTVRVSAPEWMNFINSDSLRVLRRLGLPWGTNVPPFSTWTGADANAIRAACASRKMPLTLL